MPTSDIIHVSEMPVFRWVEDEQKLEFTLVSGDRKRVFWISEHKARGAIMAARRMLDKKPPVRDNVCALQKPG